MRKGLLTSVGTLPSKRAALLCMILVLILTLACRHSETTQDTTTQDTGLYLQKMITWREGWKGSDVMDSNPACVIDRLARDQLNRAEFDWEIATRVQ